MNATDLIGYAYDADLHCPECALAAYQAGALKLIGPADEDEHGLPYELEDGEGNPIAPIFVSTELEPHDCCGDCGRKFAD